LSVWAHLWTGADAPQEYVDYILCTQLYHCLPSQLDTEDAYRINAHLICADVEGKVAKQRRANAKKS